MVHVLRPTMHGDKFDKRWFPSSGFETRGTKDTVMYHPEDNGKLQPKPHTDNIEGQQGYMSKEEVAGEPTTSGTANPKFKIPKLSERKELVSDKLNQLAASISPPAKERKRETSNITQPHKNKKGRQHDYISGTKKSRGGKRK